MSSGRKCSLVRWARRLYRGELECQFQSLRPRHADRVEIQSRIWQRSPDVRMIGAQFGVMSNVVPEESTPSSASPARAPGLGSTPRCVLSPWVQTETRAMSAFRIKVAVAPGTMIKAAVGIRLQSANRPRAAVQRQQNKRRVPRGRVGDVVERGIETTKPWIVDWA